MSTLTCQWRKLAFFNYIVSPEIIEKYLPRHTEIDFFNGQCFVSLVGFQFKDVAIEGIKVPFHTDFEEINLRCYVRHFDGQGWRQGTVFLSEIADKRLLTALANSLYNENYRTMPTKHSQKEAPQGNQYGYYWKSENQWQQMEVSTATRPVSVDPESETAFLIHKLWGYGKHNEQQTNQYQIDHPLWQVYPVQQYSLEVDFSKIFGPEFAHLKGRKPHSVILAEGSPINVIGTSKITG